MHLFRTILCGAVLAMNAGAWADTGTAAKPSTEELATVRAEADRLSDEIRTLSRRQVWTGVERKYRQVVALGTSVSSDIHLTGAYSARESGNLLRVYERLLRASTGKPNEAVIDWLWDLDHNYGRVTLLADRRRTASLTAVQMPLDPNRRNAVQGAIDICSSDGEFNGLLPKGKYNFMGQDFKVDPGIAVRVEVSPKMRRQGLVEPTIVYRELPTAAAQ